MCTSCSWPAGGLERARFAQWKGRLLTGCCRLFIFLNLIRVNLLTNFSKKAAFVTLSYLCSTCNLCMLGCSWFCPCTVHWGRVRTGWVYPMHRSLLKVCNLQHREDLQWANSPFAEGTEMKPDLGDTANAVNAVFETLHSNLYKGNSDPL